MPGYGYAAVGKAKSAAWVGLIRDYLRGRPSLMRAFVLVDGRRGIKDSDEATMTALDKAAVSYAIVLTKRDEVKAADQPALVAATLEPCANGPPPIPKSSSPRRAPAKESPSCGRMSRRCWRSGAAG